ncbi:MAG: glucosamine-6-phosphate deaminase [Ignavibacteriales bacterium]|nr:glucosamine-6-phosphate deaminase [Ignavibacteriales bacterium]
METGVLRSFTAEKLNAVVAENRTALGKLSAQHVSRLINDLLLRKEEIRIVFAAAPSQNEFLKELCNDKLIDWSKIVAFHMDEYIGLPENSDKLFSVYLNEHIFSKVKFKSVHLINSRERNTAKECKRYEALIREKPIDIVLMGIGENGHVAFNDPPVADFNDKTFMKVVELEEKCKAQQVNDAGFKSIDEVPKTAYTLTVPALLSAKYLNIVVPGIRKAEAVKNTMKSEISTKCPATILRTHSNSILFLDAESASLLE